MVDDNVTDTLRHIFDFQVFYITPANETPFNNGIFHFSKNFAGQSFFQSIDKRKSTTKVWQ